MNIGSIDTAGLTQNLENPMNILKGLTGNANGLPVNGIDNALTGITDSDTFKVVFDSLDTDSDGNLSQSEIQNGVTSGLDLLQNLLGGASKIKAFEHRAADILQNQDINNSGTLTRSETTLANIDFEKIDTNGDKNIDLDELVVSLENKINQRKYNSKSSCSKNKESLADLINGSRAVA